MTDKLKLILKNCYGIGELEKELEFKRKGCAIYAPNGVMKTSFAKTMIDLSKGESPKDLAFPKRDTFCEVRWNTELIKKEEIFVAKSYDDKYFPGEVSTLLANEDLKSKYDTIHKDIGEAKKNLDKKLRSLAGYGENSRENLDPILERIFKQQYYNALLSIKSEIDELREEDFGNAHYTIIFNPKVTEVLKSDKDDIKDFAEKYYELTEESPILSKDFQYNNVTQVHEHLKSNNFFTAGHTISLCDKNDGNKEELTTDSSLLYRIETDRRRILSDPELEQKFIVVNNKFKNKELKKFLDYLTNNRPILCELQDLDAFERKLWLQYIYKVKSDYDLLIEKYKKGLDKLAKIVSEAQQERTDWDDVIYDFNQRFLHLPFSLEVANKSDVILKKTTPSVQFKFKDDEERYYSEDQRNELLTVLSTGEARALYILNIMFAVHTRLKAHGKTLLILDDIADSFDYKNKFAIIDYLDYIIKHEKTNFRIIVLTHNFDFLRTIENREICAANQCYMALKNQRQITLTEFKNRSDIRNPFIKWKNRFADQKIQIACIPFLRNIIEYTQDREDKDYIKLTNMLHYTDCTKDLKIQDYSDIVKKHFPKMAFPEVDLNKDILGYIKETADKCLVDQEDRIHLEDKIVLSIASRILAEKFMIEKIRYVQPSYTPPPQMGKLLEYFKNECSHMKEDIKLLERINLITPANIHLNSFMYEPILDMGFEELKTLYQEVKEKLS